VNSVTKTPAANKRSLLHNPYFKKWLLKFLFISILKLLRGSYFCFFTKLIFGVIGVCPAARPSAQPAPLFCGEHRTTAGVAAHSGVLFQEHQYQHKIFPLT